VKVEVEQKFVVLNPVNLKAAEGDMDFVQECDYLGGRWSETPKSLFTRSRRVVPAIICDNQGAGYNYLLAIRVQNAGPCHTRRNLHFGHIL